MAWTWVHGVMEYARAVAHAAVTVMRSPRFFLPIRLSWLHLVLWRCFSHPASRSPCSLFCFEITFTPPLD